MADRETSKLIIAIIIAIVCIIGIVATIVTSIFAKESFGKIQRIKILSKASLDKAKEAFVGSRADMMFKGQYDYLLNRPEGDKIPTTSMPTMDTTEAVSVRQSTQHSATPAEASAVATNLAKQVASEVQTQSLKAGGTTIGVKSTTSAPSNFELDANVETHNEIVSNAGKPVSQEKFSKARVFNDFSTILGDTSMNRLSSQIAQSENQDQKTVDMKAFEMKEGFNY